MADWIARETGWYWWVPGQEPRKVEDGGQWLIPRKEAMRFEVPEELLMDYGVIPDTRSPVVIPFRRRLGWRISYRRYRLACWLYRVVSGFDLPDDL